MQSVKVTPAQNETSGVEKTSAVVDFAKESIEEDAQEDLEEPLSDEEQRLFNKFRKRIEKRLLHKEKTTEEEMYYEEELKDMEIGSFDIIFCPDKKQNGWLRCFACLIKLLEWAFIVQALVILDWMNIETSIEDYQKDVREDLERKAKNTLYVYNAENFTSKILTITNNSSTAICKCDEYKYYLSSLHDGYANDANEFNFTNFIHNAVGTGLHETIRKSCVNCKGDIDDLSGYNYDPCDLSDRSEIEEWEYTWHHHDVAISQDPDIAHEYYFNWERCDMSADEYLAKMVMIDHFKNDPKYIYVGWIDNQTWQVFRNVTNSVFNETFAYYKYTFPVRNAFETICVIAFCMYALLSTFSGVIQNKNSFHYATGSLLYTGPSVLPVIHLWWFLELVESILVLVLTALILLHSDNMEFLLNGLAMLFISEFDEASIGMICQIIKNLGHSDAHKNICLFYYKQSIIGYEGEKEDGTRHGNGKQTWANGNVYDGGWKYNKQCGQGTLTRADGTVIYDGLWEAGIPLRAK